MFCTVVWKVAKGVLVEKSEKKQTATFKNIFVLFVYEYQSNIVKYEEENVLRNIIKTRKGKRELI